MHFLTHRLLPTISKLIVKYGVVDGTNLSMKMSNLVKKEIIVLGHRNPDTDSIASAIVYSNFLCQMKRSAKAYRLGNLSNGIKFVLEKAGVQEPDLLPDDIPDNTEVALIDHNESQQSMKNLNRMRVTHVIDHHKLGDLTTSEPVFLRFEPVGCTATILTKLYRENNFAIDQKTAVLLVSAILSDTLHFRSPATTNDDRKAFEYLIPLAKIEDIKSHIDQMFEAESDLTGLSVREILFTGYKTYTFNNTTWGISINETYHPKKLLDYKDELLKAMNQEKANSNLEGFLFSIVDIINERNSTLVPGDVEQRIIRQAFKTDVHDHIADLGPIISRKKQIIPSLEEYFRRQS